MKYLDIKQLKLIVTLTETKSLTLTAKRLHLSQPAISHQLKALEDLVGESLFRREGKRFIANPAGKWLAQRSGNILNELDETLKVTRDIANGQQGKIRFATSCYPTLNWLPKVIKAYKEKYPRIDIEIKTQLVQQ